MRRPPKASVRRADGSRIRSGFPVSIALRSVQCAFASLCQASVRCRLRRPEPRACAGLGCLAVGCLALRMWRRCHAAPIRPSAMRRKRRGRSRRARRRSDSSDSPATLPSPRGMTRATSRASTVEVRLRAARCCEAGARHAGYGASVAYRSVVDGTSVYRANTWSPGSIAKVPLCGGEVETLRRH